MNYTRALKLAQYEISESAKVGLRVLPKGDPDCSIGEIMDGVCAIDYSREDAIDLIKNYHNGKIYIVAGEAREGVDIGEIVISDALIIGILD